MTESAYVCGCCLLEYHRQEELVEHQRSAHERGGSEPDLELARRLGAEASELVRAQEQLSAHPIDELAQAEGLGARLERVRSYGAAAIAGDQRASLLEARAELVAIHVRAAELRDSYARIAALGLDSIDVVTRVLEILPERVS